MDNNDLKILLDKLTHEQARLEYSEVYQLTLHINRDELDVLAKVVKHHYAVSVAKEAGLI